MNGIKKDKYTLLSICIPTYNRYEILREGLNILLPQIKGLDIKVYVIDNNSTDDTVLIANEYSDIIYIRNEKNIGGDMNILKAYQIASQTSEYICVLGDSYRFKNRLDSIMDLLLPCDLNLLVLNRECEFSGIHSRYYYSADEILSDLGGGMDLIGSIVVNKKAVLEENYVPYLWSNFIHVGMVFNYLSSLDSLKCYFLREQVLYHTNLDKTKVSWYKDMFEIFAKTWMLTILSLPATLSIDSKLQCTKKHDIYTGVFRLKCLLYLRGFGYVKYKDIKKYSIYIPFVTDVPILYMYLISMIPQFIVQSLIFLNKMKSVMFLWYILI